MKCWRLLDNLFLHLECYRLADWCHRRWCNGCMAHSIFQMREETK